MPNLTFKKQFAEAVKSGKKTMTIRRSIKKGCPFVHLFTGLKTEQCEKLGVGIITGIKEIIIHDEYSDFAIEINGMDLSEKFKEGLAINDGFKSSDEFIDFFKKQYGLPFSGVLIEWRLKDGSFNVK